MKAHVTLEAEQDVLVTWLGHPTLFNVAFTAEGEAYYQAARISGPPEQCSPEEGEAHITSITITQVLDEDGEPVQALPALRDRLRAGLNEARISDLIWEAAWEEWNERDIP